MKSKLLFLLVALGFLTASAFAQSASDLRRRMEQRLPAIDALKAQEVVGENNRGFLEKPPGAKPGGEAVLTDENRDREAVYALIAKETGASPDAVGRARAKRIAAGSHGVWVQDEAGRWAKK